MSESSQLKRLAKPIPPRYVKAPAQGKYGSYVPHDVIGQILLAVVGPFDFKIEQIVHGCDGMVEGITASMTLEIDGRTVTVTEVGDCEQPGNWKTQGARMKDAASDALKRCAMRFGCGLHLWAQEDYFLYDQLKSSGPPTSASSRASGGSEPAEGAGPDEEAHRGGPRTSDPAPSSPVTVPSSVTAAEPEDRPPAASGSAPSASRMQRAKSRVGALLAAKVSVSDERTKRVLPPLNDEISPEEFELWCVMLDDLEKTLA